MYHMSFQYLSDIVEDLDLESDRSHCRGPIADITRKEIEVINMRNVKSPGKSRIVNLLGVTPRHEESLYAQSSSQSIRAVKTLRDQVQSLHDTVNLLEERLTVLEDKLKK